MRRKKKLNCTLLASSNLAKVIRLRQNIIDVEKSLKHSYDSWRLDKEAEACANIKVNPSAFYKFIRRKSNIKGGIGPFVDNRGEPITGLKDMANILQQQYSSVYSCPDANFRFEDAKEFFRDIRDENPLTDIHVTPEDVITALCILRT